MNHYKNDNNLNKLTQMNPIQKELDYFITCADAGSLLRAAEKLAMQQAGLSKVIQKLESDLGEKVFYRKSRGIELTDFGAQLYKLLKNTKNYWNENFSLALEESHGLSGKLSIGAHPTVATNIFPKIIPELNQKFPMLKFEFEFLTSLEATRKVANLEIDLGIVINPVKNSELITKQIESEFVALWKSKKNISQNLAYNPDMYMSSQHLKKLSGYKLITIRDYEVIAGLVQSSDFIGILPQKVAERYQLEMIGEPLMNVQIALIWHKDKFANKSRSEIIHTILKK